jgi:hypothetical protein
LAEDCAAAAEIRMHIGHRHAAHESGTAGKAELGVSVVRLGSEVHLPGECLDGARQNPRRAKRAISTGHCLTVTSTP